jgi:PAS domain S-box-containing protein
MHDDELHRELVELAPDAMVILEQLERRVQERTAELHARTEELAKSEARFRALVEGVEDYAIFMLDPQGCVESWTPCAERILGYAESEILGKHFSCFYPPEDVLRNHPEQVLRAAIENGHFEETGWRVRKNGSRVWTSVLITALRDESGRLCGFSDIKRDITERKRVGEKLRQSEEQFQALLESAPDALVIVSGSGKIALVNFQAERMFGYERQELIGEPLKKLLGDKLLGDKLLGAAVASGGSELGQRCAEAWGASKMELTCVRKNSVELPVEVTTRPIQTPQGTWVVLAIRDITERKLAEGMLIAERRKAEAANGAKSQFLARMSHEIRTPMNAILGMSDLLWESELNPEQRQYVDVFRRAGANLLNLIDGILDLSKIESGRFALERIEFDLEEVVNEALELVSAQAHAKGLAMLARVAPDLNAALIGDPARLRQVLINLLGNAVKFTESGEVILEIQPAPFGEPGEIQFTVSDTGIGIPPEKLTTIFEDFVQADSSTTRKYGGSGLGLAICRRLVERMGGKLRVHSSIGKGSKFQFAAQFAPAPARQKLPAEVKDFRGLRALIVDNNPTNRLILRETLNAWGIVCEESGSPDDAIPNIAASIFSAKPYSLLFIDHRLPQIDGFELALRARRLGCSAPMIMLSSDVRPGDVTRSREAGFAGHAVKPVRRSELLRLVCAAINADRRQDSVPSLSPPPQTAAAMSGSPGLRILIAEDSSDNRLLLEAYLKGTPHRVTFVEDGKAAVDRFSSPEFDLVLMDVAMPIMDGLTATQTIRAIELEQGLPRTPIMAITANARPEDIDETRESGCDAHLSKPISKRRLLAEIEKYSRPGIAPTAKIGPDVPVPEEEPASAGAGTVLVRIPEGLEEIAPQYLKLRKEEARRLAELLQSREFDRIRVLAHNLRGTGAAYGLPVLTQMGAAIESAARASDEPALRAQIPKLGEYLARVEMRPADTPV